MAEDGDPLEPEVMADRVEVVDVVVDPDARRIDASARLSAAALVVVDEPVTIRQPVHVGQQVAVIEVRAAVQFLKPLLDLVVRDLEAARAALGPGCGHATLSTHGSATPSAAPTPYRRPRPAVVLEVGDGKSKYIATVNP